MKKIDLEYRIIGGGKTVLVIEVGIGNSFYDWSSFIQEIKKDFTVLIYHRAGYGKSQVSYTPRTTRNIAEELNYLIEKIGLEQRFILMGHSFGGLCVQQYAKMYPDKLSSIILLDSTSFNFKQLDMPDTPVMNSLREMDKWIDENIDSSKKSKEELINENKDFMPEYRKYISAGDMNDFEEFHANPTLYKTVAEELKNWDIDSKDIKNISFFPNIPLAVIARDNKIAEEYWIKNGAPEKEAALYETEWRRLQIELSKLSIQGEFIIAENSSHEIYLDRPELIVQCLKKLSQ